MSGKQRLWQCQLFNNSPVAATNRLPNSSRAEVIRLLAVLLNEVVQSELRELKNEELGDD
jgi:hypothetical protein